jgi:SAM-dependent methyltransferase
MMTLDARMLMKLFLFPGLDLHTRCRLRFLSPWIMSGELETLDAGFGNGALIYQANRKGNRVVGISLSEHDVQRTRAFFDFLHVCRDRVELTRLNVYDIQTLGRTFDQIICTEMLEHLTRDAEVIQMFSKLLRPGGRLIVSVPYSLHPHHALGRTSQPEDGGHVRDGYTVDSIGQMFDEAGLRIIEILGLGSPLLGMLDVPIRTVRNRFGTSAAIPLFLALLPLTYLDRPNPTVPISLAFLVEKMT